MLRSACARCSHRLPILLSEYTYATSARLSLAARLDRPCSVARNRRCALPTQEGTFLHRRVGQGRVQVSRWRERDCQLRLAGIERDSPRGAPPSTIDVARLVELTTTQSKPEAATHNVFLRAIKPEARWFIYRSVHVSRSEAGCDALRSDHRAGRWSAMLLAPVRRYATGQCWPLCSERSRVGAGEPYGCGAASNLSTWEVNTMHSLNTTPAPHEVRVPVGAGWLYGDLVLPPGFDGLVLFAHGSGSGRHSARAGRHRLGRCSTRIAACRHRAFRRQHRQRRCAHCGRATGPPNRCRGLPRWPAGPGGARGPGGGDGNHPAHRRRGADHQVIKLIEQAHAHLRCEKSLVMVPGATHLFEEAGALEQVAHLASSWFTAHLMTPRYTT